MDSARKFIFMAPELKEFYNIMIKNHSDEVEKEMRERKKEIENLNKKIFAL